MSLWLLQHIQKNPEWATVEQQSFIVKTLMSVRNLDVLFRRAVVSRLMRLLDGEELAAEVTAVGFCLR